MVVKEELMFFNNMYVSVDVCVHMCTYDSSVGGKYLRELFMIVETDLRSLSSKLPSLFFMS